MAKLTPEEAKMLKRLRAREEAPDESPIGRSVNVSVDLGDPKQVETARKLGLLGSSDDDDDDTDGDTDDSDGDTAPKRRGYFPT